MAQMWLYDGNKAVTVQPHLTAEVILQPWNSTKEKPKH